MQTRGGGGGPGTGRRSVRAALGAFAKELVTKHFLVAGMFVSILLAALDPTVRAYFETTCTDVNG